MIDGKETRQVPRTARMNQRAREVFIDALSRGVSVTGAFTKAGLPRSTVYDWRGSDADFAKAWDDAIEAGADVLEDEAFRRAYHGVSEPLTSMGRPVKNEDGSIMTIQKYSDTLMTLLLKARKPEKFRERIDQKTEHSGGISITITPDDANL